MWRKTTPSDSEYTKSFRIAFLLCLFFGILGAHRFYTGYAKEGGVFLLCGLTGVGAIVSGVWSLVDLVMILSRRYTTPNGKPLK